MSERGVFAVDRGIWEHDLLTSREPFSRREAWLWLVSEAAWKPHRRRISGHVISLERGQVVASLRFMAEKWRWAEPRVRRFLEALKNEGMTVSTTDAGVTVITICKYDEYQRVSLPDDAATDAETGAAPTQDRRKVEGKESKEPFSFIDSNCPREVSDDWPDDYRERFWLEYPNKVGKPKALEILERVRKRRMTSWSELFSGLVRYVHKTDDRAWCNPATWLNQQRWTDQPAAIPPRGPPGERISGFAAVMAEQFQQDQRHEPDYDA